MPTSDKSFSMVPDQLDQSEKSFFLEKIQTLESRVRDLKVGNEDYIMRLELENKKLNAEVLENSLQLQKYQAELQGCYSGRKVVEDSGILLHQRLEKVKADLALKDEQISFLKLKFIEQYKIPFGPKYEAIKETKTQFPPPTDE